MFSNGVPHEKQKTFLMQICKIAQRNKIFETSIRIFKEYSKIWQNAGIFFLFFLSAAHRTESCRRIT